jgi:hypothetical protein
MVGRALGLGDEQSTDATDDADGVLCIGAIGVIGGWAVVALKSENRWPER